MTNVEQIRTFIAVQLPQHIKERFAEVQRKLEASGADVRWVKPGNAHITLQFLGDTPVTRIEAIETALHRVSSSHSPFDVSVEGLGVFPNERRPRVVWIGVTQGANSLAALQSSVSTEMIALGFKLEKRGFSPHITLGRVRSSKNVGQLIRILNTERDFLAGTFHATEVHLIRSVLSSDGPTYSPLCSSSFATSA